MGNHEPDRERFMSDTTATTQGTDTSAADVTTATTDQTATSETAKVEEKDWQAEAEKWKSLSRKHEDSAKANADKAKRFEEFEESQKTETQKATDEAAKAAKERDDSRAELAVMKAAVKHGLSEDDLDLLGTHGTPDEIDSRAEKLAGRLKAADATKPKPDFGGGDRGGDVTSGKEVDVIDGQIADAQKAGNFQLVIALRQQRSALLAEQKKS